MIDRPLPCTRIEEQLGSIHLSTGIVFFQVREPHHSNMYSYIYDSYTAYDIDTQSHKYSI